MLKTGHGPCISGETTLANYPFGNGIGVYCIFRDLTFVILGSKISYQSSYGSLKSIKKSPNEHLDILFEGRQRAEAVVKRTPTTLICPQSPVRAIPSQRTNISAISPKE